MKRIDPLLLPALLCVLGLFSGWDAQAEHYDVYILTGQSNALGTTRYDGERSGDYGPGEHEADQRIEMLWSNVHASNGTYPPKLYGDSGGKIVPLSMQQGDGRHNPRFWGPEFGLARQLVEHTPNKLLIIKASRGGGGNGFWEKAEYDREKHAGHMWRHLCDTVDLGLEALSNKGVSFTVKGLIYLQGESNTIEQAKAAGPRLQSLHQNLRDHIQQRYPNAANKMKFVVGEIAASKTSQARRITTEQHREAEISDPLCAFVQTHDLPLQPDKIHFGKKAKQAIGRRMADALRLLDLSESQRELVAQAQSRLVAWRNSGDGDVPGERPLIMTLFTGSDTDPAPNYRERLTRTMKHIQAFYASQMQRHGFGPITFQMQTNADDLLDIHVVRGDRPNDQYSGKDGKAIREMVLKHLQTKGIDGTKETIVIFCNLTKWDPETRRMSHHSPYYAGGSHQAGTAWQLDSPLLDAAEIANTDKDQYLHDGQYGHISLGRYQSIFVGGVCHELGHALGLPHNKQCCGEGELRGTALMGSGNFTYAQEVRGEGKGSFLTLAHAMKLAAHPAFTGSVKQMRQGPKRNVKDLKVELILQNKAVRISGDIDSDIPVHAVLVYLDPEGGSDYDATTHVAVPDKNGLFTIDCDSFAGERGDIRLVYLHTNGWAAWNKDVLWPYSRMQDGQLTIGERSDK